MRRPDHDGEPMSEITRGYNVSDSTISRPSRCDVGIPRPRDFFILWRRKCRSNGRGGRTTSSVRSSCLVSERDHSAAKGRSQQPHRASGMAAQERAGSMADHEGQPSPPRSFFVVLNSPVPPAPGSRIPRQRASPGVTEFKTRTPCFPNRRLSTKREPAPGTGFGHISLKNARRQG
jgi:hypothetical protein